MATYFSTFIPGLGEVVKDQLSKDLKNFSVRLLYDGLFVYETDSPAEDIKKLRYLNNSFLQVSPTEKITLNLGHTFRVVFSKENELVAINRERLVKIESRIAELNNLTVDRSNPDFEFWFLKRSEGDKFTGVRLTRHPDYKTVLAKGQLRPELANLLCLLSQPNPDDVVLDPFAGSGAIAMERERFPNKNIISGDIVPGCPNIQKLDALNTKLDAGSIDKIITDPPWGISVGKELNLPKFYSQMLQEFTRLLKSGGLLIILIGKKEIFEESLRQANKLVLLKRYDILVSGKKAAIYKLGRDLIGQKTIP